MGILKDLQVLMSSESENHIFSVWSVRVSLSVCIYLSVISITQKQITAESSNLAIYIYMIGGCSFKLFIKIGRKLCAQGHAKKILIH